MFLKGPWLCKAAPQFENGKSSDSGKQRHGLFRHARTGFETLTRERMGAYAHAHEKDKAIGAQSGYMRGSGHGFEEIGRVESRFNRLVVYPSNLLHSGILPDDYDFSPDPRRGRLTTNIFLTERCDPALCREHDRPG